MVLALSILKHGSRSFTFLRSLFPLPSRQNLQTILNIFSVQQASIHMCLVYSGALFRLVMKIVCFVSCLMNYQSERNLCFIHKFSCMVGFENLGNHGRTSNIAKHAMVFNLHGLNNKWKQPVAYYLIDGGAKGEMLVNFLMEVLDASHNAGLEVVTTI